MKGNTPLSVISYLPFILTYSNHLHTFENIKMQSFNLFFIFLVVNEYLCIYFGNCLHIITTSQKYIFGYLIFISSHHLQRMDMKLISHSCITEDMTGCSWEPGSPLNTCQCYCTICKKTVVKCACFYQYLTWTRGSIIKISPLWLACIFMASISAITQDVYYTQLASTTALC